MGGDHNEAKERWPKQKVGELVAVGRGSNDYWLCRMLEGPWKNPKLKHRAARATRTGNSK